MSYTVRNFKWDCSTERVAERGKSVVVQGDIAVVAEVVVEPDSKTALKLNQPIIGFHLAEAPRLPEPIVSTLLSSSSLARRKYVWSTSKTYI